MLKHGTQYSVMYQAPCILVSWILCSKIGCPAATSAVQL